LNTISFLLSHIAQQTTVALDNNEDLRFWPPCLDQELNRWGGLMPNTKWTERHKALA
jgi:hypothetical protein